MTKLIEELKKKGVKTTRVTKRSLMAEAEAQGLLDKDGNVIVSKRTRGKK